jgi:hypothetical protein
MFANAPDGFLSDDGGSSDAAHERKYPVPTTNDDPFDDDLNDPLMRYAQRRQSQQAAAAAVPKQAGKRKPAAASRARAGAAEAPSKRQRREAETATTAAVAAATDTEGKHEPGGVQPIDPPQAEACSLSGPMAWDWEKEVLDMYNTYRRYVEQRERLGRLDYIPSGSPQPNIDDDTPPYNPDDCFLCKFVAREQTDSEQLDAFVEDFFSDVRDRGPKAACYAAHRRYNEEFRDTHPETRCDFPPAMIMYHFAAESINRRMGLLLLERDLQLAQLKASRKLGLHDLTTGEIHVNDGAMVTLKIIIENNLKLAKIQESMSITAGASKASSGGGGGGGGGGREK